MQPNANRLPTWSLTKKKYAMPAAISANKMRHQYSHQHQHQAKTSSLNTTCGGGGT